MKKEIIAVGKTVEAAVSNGASELGVDVSRVTYEVIEAPKKGFLGFGEAPAKVKLTFVPGPEDAALEFVRTVVEDLEISADIEIARDYSGSSDRVIRISGEEAGVLIGHHGDTMDALQCLVNIAANRRDGADGEGEDGEDGDSKNPYCRISVDIENYRAKREETLRRLARGMAQKVLRSGKNVVLEPMNPYERRIIHSEIQNMKGVTTYSVGSDNNRKIVIALAERRGGGRRAPEAKAEAVEGDEE